MKYSENNKPLACILTESRCYKNSYRITPKGVLWHSTGANNPTLKRYVQPSKNDANYDKLMALLGKNTYNNDWNQDNLSVGVNAFIGKLADGTITTAQTLPWDMRPWGCASGRNGSCNNGWIQFEICEDNLKDKAYFDAVYQEACELTAYLCKMYNLNPFGTVAMNGIKVPVILCHADSYDLGVGSNHGDVLHWFPKYGKTMEDVRKDVAALMDSFAPAQKEETVTATEELYRIRKSWEDSNSQIGAYRNLDSAKSVCDAAGSEYKAYNSKGEQVYPETKTELVARKTLKKGSIGDDVEFLQTKLVELGYNLGSIDGDFGSKTEAAVRAFQKDMDLEKDGICGPMTWAALNSAKYAKGKVTASLLNVRIGPSTGYKVSSQLKNGANVIIVSEQNGWGRLINAAGYVSLDYIKKI